MTQEADVKVKSLYLNKKQATKMQTGKQSTKGQAEAKAKKRKKRGIVQT